MIIERGRKIVWGDQKSLHLAKLFSDTDRNDQRIAVLLLVPACLKARGLKHRNGSIERVVKQLHIRKLAF